MCLLFQVFQFQAKELQEFCSGSNVMVVKLWYGISGPTQFRSELYEISKSAKPLSANLPKKWDLYSWFWSSIVPHPCQETNHSIAQKTEWCLDSATCKKRTLALTKGQLTFWMCAVAISDYLHGNSKIGHTTSLKFSTQNSQQMSANCHCNGVQHTKTLLSLVLERRIMSLRLLLTCTDGSSGIIALGTIAFLLSELMPVLRTILHRAHCSCLHSTLHLYHALKGRQKNAWKEEYKPWKYKHTHICQKTLSW